MRGDAGFSLIELLVASSVTLLVLGATLSTFGNALSVHDATTLIGDSSQNLRAGGSLMMRELMQAGRGIPTGGIPVPSGAGAMPINRPGPPGTAYTFGDPTVTTTLPPVGPGPGLGPVVLGVATDMVTILLVDHSLKLDQTAAGDPVYLQSVAPDGSSITIDSSIVINAPDTGVVAGDLILITNGNGTTLKCVTGVAGQAISFASGDWFNLNQTGAAQGTLLQLQNQDGTYPPTKAERILMVTYYVDNATTPDRPRLTRQVDHNDGQHNPQALAGVVESLTATYDIFDGATNPTNVPAPTPPNTPQQIRKINLSVGVRSDLPSMQLRRFIRSRVTTQISFRNLSFVDRYQ